VDNLVIPAERRGVFVRNRATLIAAGNIQSAVVASPAAAKLEMLIGNIVLCHNGQGFKGYYSRIVTTIPAIVKNAFILDCI
jgi:hypothetical protein